MKKIIKYVLLFIVLFGITNIKAFADPGCVQECEEGINCCEKQIKTNTWTYDSTKNKYVYRDENGNITRELDKLEDDPLAKRGKLSITAKMPEDFKDSTVTIDIYSSIYSYSIILNKNNGFKQEIDVIEGLYSVSYHNVSNHNDITSPITKSFKVYENETTSYELDYTKYSDNKHKKKKEQSKVKKIIVIVAISAIVLAFIIIILMFLKARSI